MAGAVLSDRHRRKDIRHVLCGSLGQSVFRHFFGHDGVNNAARLVRDPTMRWIVGGRADHDCAVSARPVVADERARITCEDRHQSRAPRPLRRIPDSRGRTMEKPGALRSRPKLSRNSTICYRLPGSRVYLGNVGLRLAQGAAAVLPPSIRLIVRHCAFSLKTTSHTR